MIYKNFVIINLLILNFTLNCIAMEVTKSIDEGKDLLNLKQVIVNGQLVPKTSLSALDYQGFVSNNLQSFSLKNIDIKPVEASILAISTTLHSLELERNNFTVTTWFHSVVRRQAVSEVICALTKKGRDYDHPIRPLTSLKTLKIVDNNLCDHEFRHILGSNYIVNLESLDLSGNNITGGEGELNYLFKDAVNLKTLNLANNPLVPQAIELLKTIEQNWSGLTLIYDPIKIIEN
jgi:hypothetical protein